MKKHFSILLVLFMCCLYSTKGLAQDEKPKQDSGSTESESDSSGRTRNQEIELGSSTAKGGFKNEDEIRDKFNHWQTDADARLWLETMNFRIADIINVEATKPHGEKADIKVRITTRTGVSTAGISIKLVSNPRGFNQIDKRWLRNYVQMWEIPDNVHETLKLFVGEKAPTKTGRDVRRMFLDEIDEAQQQELIHFFSANRERIISDLFSGDGEHAAGWLMVTLKTGNAEESGKKKKSSDRDAKKNLEKNANEEIKNEASSDSVDDRSPNWVLCTSKEAAEFFGEGKIQITPQGSLKIGRITMQRKGGDNGRESANMLQFKINPVDLFELKKSP